VTDFEIYVREQRIIGICPTNDGLGMLYVAWPHEEFAQVRADIEANYLQSLDLVPDLAARVREGRREGSFKGTADMLNFFRQPYGPGWALVGDAGYHKDVITAYGITDAFRSAELLAEALDAGFSERQPLDEALAGYEQQRNEVALPLYDLTGQFASLEQNSPEQEQFYRALGRNAAQTSRFLGVIEGTVPVSEFFDPANVARIMEQSR
jgi:flavin-dependent dehydrogenase